MTNKELSAAIKDLDAQLEEFMFERLTMQAIEAVKAELRSNRVSVSNQDGQAGGALYEGPAPAERGESHSSDSPRITFAEPEPHTPTKFLGWLLVSLTIWGVSVLGWAIWRAWPQIVRMVR